MHNTALLIVVVGTALAFDFTNGFHDTANAMATTIATRALSPRVAVTLAGLLNFAGAFISLKVATTIAKGIVDSKLITLEIVFAGLIGAVLWNLTTWYLSLPSSSSHALVGGIVGATLAAKGTAAIKGSGILAKVLFPALFAPLIAGGIAIAGTFLAYRLASRLGHASRDRGFRVGQIASSSLVALAHGTNDAQKTMGVITLALVANGSIGSKASVPTWVIVAAATAIALGTYVGGWRIIRTLGTRITEIEPPQGFAAEAAAATTILASSFYGYALSTTHVVSGSVIGSGLGRRLAHIRWGVAGRMAVAWVFTLPVAALVAAGVQRASGAFGSDTAAALVLGAVALAIAIGFFVLARRDPVSASNVNANAPGDELRAPSSEAVPA